MPKNESEPNIRYNGRLPEGLLKNAKGFQMTHESGNQTVFAKEAMKGINQAMTDLPAIFFSDKNIDALQEAIRYQVWKNSCQKHVIGRQSDDELKIVMRSIYFQYSKNQPYNILEQVRELNSKVLDYCVKQIVEELKMYTRYTQDITTLPVPLAHSVNVSNKGTKTLELKEW